MKKVLEKTPRRDFLAKSATGATAFTMPIGVEDEE